MARWVWTSAMLACAVTTLAPAAAWARKPTRVLLLCTDDATCDAFATRVRGQTSDLAVHIARDRAAARGNDWESELEHAERRASDGHDVVVWWRGGDVVTFLRDPPPGRVLVRTITRRRTVASADLEAGALVARTAIKAAHEGAPIGEPRVIARKPAPRPPERPSAPERVRAAGALGWALAWDGVATDPGSGLDARAGIAIGPAFLGGLWYEGLAKGLDLPDARGTYQRRVFGAAANLDFPIGDRWGVGVGVRAGAEVTIVVPESGPYRDTARIPRPFAGGELRVRRVFGRRLAAVIGVALDHVWDPPRVGVRSEMGLVPVWDVAPWQPSVGVGLAVTLP